MTEITVENHPTASTVKNWVDILFDTWHSWHACPRSEERHPTIDPAIAAEIEWTNDSIFKFFEVKDRDYCRQYDIENGID